MPPVLGAALIGGAAGAFGLTAATIAGSTILGGAVLYGGLAAASYLLAPKPKVPNIGNNLSGNDPKSTVRTSIMNRRWILGRARVGGMLAFADEADSNENDLWMVMVLGEAPMDSIEGVWIDGKKVDFSRSAAGVITPTSSDEHYRKVTIWEVFDGSGSVSGAGPTALRAACKAWTSSHEGNGRAYVIIRLRQPDYTNEDSDDERYWTSVPQLEFQVKGLKFTYPGQATAAWTENAAAIRYWWLRNRRLVPAAAIDTTSVTAAITVCGTSVAVSRPTNEYADWPANEIRYACNGVVDSVSDMEQVEAELDWCWQGHAVEMDGVFHFRPGVDRTVETNKIGPADIIEVTGFKPAPSLQERANTATMSLDQSSRHDYDQYAVPEFTDSAALARDVGRYHVDLGSRMFVKSPSAANRLLATYFRRARASIRLTLRLSPSSDFKWLLLMPMDRVKVTEPTIGLSDWIGSVMQTKLNDDWSVEVTLEEAPDGIHADNPGLGQIPGRAVRPPRRSTPPPVPTITSITSEARVADDGAYFWRVQVKCASRNAGLAVRMTAGNVVEEKFSRSNIVHFDMDVPKQELLFNCWHVSKENIRGSSVSRKVTPNYNAVSIPTPDLDAWQQFGSIFRVVLNTEALRGIAGAEFRYTYLGVSATTKPAAITATGWQNALKLDAVPVVLRPGEDMIFNIAVPRTAKFRIYCRYIDSVGRLGPLGELGDIILVQPAGDVETILGAPEWKGTRNFMETWNDGAKVLLMPDRDGVASLPWANWEGYATKAFTKSQYRYRTKGGTWGSWTDVAFGTNTVTVTGLTNGTEYEFEVRQVDGSDDGTAASIKATPLANSTVPPKPTGASATAGNTRVTLKAEVVEDSRVPVTKWQYKQATTSAGLSSATWTDIASSAKAKIEHAVTGLTNGTTYYFQLRAVNSVGNGTASDAVNEAPDSGVWNTGGTGSLTDPYVLDLTAVATAQNILAEIKQSNASTFSVDPSGTGSTKGNIFALCKFTIAASQNTTVQVAFVNSEVDIDVFLYSEASNVPQNQIGSGTGTGNSETITQTLAAGDYFIAMQAAGGWPSGYPASMTKLTLEVSAGAGGSIQVNPFNKPEKVQSARLGDTGAEMTWNEPVVPEGYTLGGYEVQYKSGVLAAWANWEGDWDGRRVYAPSGVSNDYQWRVRAKYTGGPTGTAYSDWEVENILDLFSSGAAGASGPTAPTLEATIASGQVKVDWVPTVNEVQSYWPWGECEGYNAAYNVTTSSWYQTPIVDMGSTINLSAFAELKHFEPPLAAQGAGGAQGNDVASVLRVDDAEQPRFSNALYDAVWATGQAIPDVTVPYALCEADHVTYHAYGLPRGLQLNGRIIEGTPSLAAGSVGIARIVATGEKGGSDDLYFHWRIVGALGTLTGDGSYSTPYEISAGAMGNIRELLKPGRTDAASIVADTAGSGASVLATWFEVSVPANRTCAVTVWGNLQDNEDVDLVHHTQSHIQASAGGGNREQVVFENDTASAVTKKVGVFFNGAHAITPVNASVEGQPTKPALWLSWGDEAPESGPIGYDEENAASGQNVTYAPGSESVSDIYFRHGTAKNSLTQVGPITDYQTVNARYVQFLVHFRKWRGRAVEQFTGFVRKL